MKRSSLPFHVKQLWRSTALLSGVALSDTQIGRLADYRHWLATEAKTAGGIGPDEVDRLDTRHIADSLLFGSQIEANHIDIWDFGTGVGLPGIPLAILFPTRRLTLIDRSGRRVRLARRAIRILELDNVSVVQSDVTKISGSADVIVARASLTAEMIAPVAMNHLRTPGICLVGGSWVEEPRVPGWETVQISLDDLDRPVWILKMRAQ